MKQALTLFLLFTVCFFTAGFRGCASAEQKTNVRRGLEASARLAKLTENLQDAIEEGYDQRILSKEQAQALNDLNEKFISGVTFYNGSVDLLQKKYASGGVPSGSEINALSVVFNEQVWEAFTKILERFGALSPQQSMVLKTAVMAIKGVVETIRSTLKFKPDAVAISGGEKWHTLQAL